MSHTHEDLSRRVHGHGPSDRSFGWVFAVGFLFFGLSPLRHGKPTRYWCLAVSAAILLITLVRPSLLHGLNLAWTKLGLLLGKVVNPIVTALLFYLIFTPVGIVLRWIGKDMLRLAIDPRATSYWIERDASVDQPDMANQF